MYGEAVENGGLNMRIECEICGTQWEVEMPINNICPFCNSIGSLFVHKEPREVKVWTREDFER